MRWIQALSTRVESRVVYYIRHGIIHDTRIGAWIERFVQWVAVAPFNDRTALRTLHSVFTLYERVRQLFLHRRQCGQVVL